MQKRWWQKHIGMFLEMKNEQFRISLHISSPFQVAILKSPLRKNIFLISAALLMVNAIAPRAMFSKIQNFNLASILRYFPSHLADFLSSFILSYVYFLSLLMHIPQEKLTWCMFNSNNKLLTSHMLQFKNKNDCISINH